MSYILHVFHTYLKYDQKSTFLGVLQEASLPIVSTAKCVDTDYHFYAKYIKETNFCAGFRNGTSVCQGDSGGSMTIEEGGIYYIRGIVSFGPGRKDYKTNETVCDTKKYAIFTDVAQYLPWINNNAMLNITIECKNEVRCASLNTNKCTVDLTLLDAFDENCKFVFYERPNAAITVLWIVGRTNVIPRLSHGLTKFKNLETLRLDSLNIKIVQRVRLAAFRKILKLDLAHNEITQLDGDTFDGLKSFEELYLQSNNLKELDVDLFKELQNLKQLRLDDNQLEKLPATIFHNNKKMEFLDLSENKLAELHVDLFKELENLSELQLDGNQIEILPATIFHNNTKLKILYLYSNKLAELHVDLFKELENLERISLANNLLEILPEGLFRANVKLSYIHLQSNKIKKIGSDFNNKRVLDMLDLRGNVCIDELCVCLYSRGNVVEKILRNCSN